MLEKPIPVELKKEQANTGVSFEFKSSISNIDQAVDMCLADIEHLFSEIQIETLEKYKIDYGLRELLVNAVVYGSLQLQKDPNEVFEAGERQKRIETLEKEYSERAALPIKVFLSRRKNVLIIRIIDQGKGFEKTKVLDPVKDEHLLNQTGRGLRLTEEFLGTIIYKKTPQGFEARVEKEMFKSQNE